MEFRLVIEEDLINCTNTFIEVFNDAPWNDQWTWEKANKYVSDFYQTPGFLGILAIDNKEMIGCILGIKRVWWEEDEYFINEMFVKQNHQNRGVGKKLLDYLIKELRNRNIYNMTLLTDRGIPAEKFYKNNGFEEIERLIFLYKSTK